MNFEFATATRIIFGTGKLQDVPALVKSRALVVIGKSAGAIQRSEPLLSSLDEYATFSVSGEPTLDVVRAGLLRCREEKCDVVVSFGGGSVIDTGKAIAMLLTNGGDPLDYAEVIGRGQSVKKPSALFIAIPTTAGTGAEVTRNAVLGSPEHHVKVSLRSPFMLPAVAVVDSEVMIATPESRLDALTQLIEPFVSGRANPLTDALCREGMQRAVRATREDLALASLFSGLALANAGLGAVHGFAGPLGGMYDAPHGALCAALLPAVFEMNEEALRRTSVSLVSPGMNEQDARSTLGRFAEVRRIVGDLTLGLKVKSLRELGVRQAEFPAIIEKAKAASSMKANPVVLTDAQLREILERAW
ncbi:MAG: iron-containing alcohol dehydrogenase [Verrucomicrobiota bacterium]